MDDRRNSVARLCAVASVAVCVLAAASAFVLPDQVAALDCVRTRSDRVICFDKTTGRLANICMFDKIASEWRCSPMD